MDEKFNNTEVYKKMDGTNSTQSYLVVAKNEKTGLQLGIKPLVGVVKGRITIGFRLRSAAIPAAGAFDPPENGWAFDWSKISSQRASLMRMIVLERGPNEAKSAHADLQALRYGGKVNAFLQEHVAEDELVVSPDDISQYMMETAEKMFSEFEGHYDPKEKLAALEAKKVEFDEWYTKTKTELTGDISSMEQNDVPPLKGAVVAELTDPDKVSSSMSQLKDMEVQGEPVEDVDPDEIFDD